MSLSLKETLARRRDVLARNADISKAKIDAIEGRLRRAGYIPSARYFFDKEALLEATVTAIFGFAAPRIDDAIQKAEDFLGLDFGWVHDGAGAPLHRFEGRSLFGAAVLALEGQLDVEAFHLSETTNRATASIILAGENGVPVRRMYAWGDVEPPPGERFLALRREALVEIGIAIGARASFAA